jgi:tRNA uridine 5-carboxymethylaminomethyl modification enzyme
MGRELGLVDDDRWRRFDDKRRAIEQERQRLANTWCVPGKAIARALERQHGVVLSKECTALDLLKRPECDYAMLASIEELGAPVEDPRVAEQVEIHERYAGYLDRQADDIARRRRHEDTALDEGFDYTEVKGLSAEVTEKLQRVRPATVGQASRVPGVTPAAISLLLVHLKKRAQRAA